MNEILDGLSEREYLDIIAPRVDNELEYAEPVDDHVQGCASCGYDPDFCSCEAYAFLREEEL